ncbi:MAG: hypothetical protein K2P85_01730 [Flavobacteriaceae bacterium]|nr:hypothetical protein [Flavobacteriaceae bacterium]
MKQQEAEMLLKASLESEKKERERIAADLHDSVSSDLSAIRNYLVVILKGESDLERIDLFKELKEGVEVAIENTRLVSYKLMPPLLDKLGFVVAMEDYLSNLSKKTVIPFEFISNEFDFELSTTVSYELFRIVQEFTTNMLKYGGITKCSIVVHSIATEAYVEVIDDGDSFDYEKELKTASGTGLKNISSRLKMIGGSIFAKEVAVGNHFVISIPLKS